MNYVWVYFDCGALIAVCDDLETAKDFAKEVSGDHISFKENITANRVKVYDPDHIYYDGWIDRVEMNTLL